MKATLTERIEGNKLIAEFMKFNNCIIRNQSGKKYDYNLPEQFELIKEVETTIESNWCEVLEYQDYCMNEDLKFHSSWDWLMPVVEKIEKIKIENYEIQFNIMKNTGKWTPSHWDGLNPIIAETKIEAVWLTVLNFIDIYNKLYSEN